MVEPRPYEPNPRYPPAGAPVRTGWAAVAAAVSSTPAVVAVDGPAVLDWNGAVSGLAKAFADRGLGVQQLDLSAHFHRWPDILRRTASAELPDDPNFATLPDCQLGDLLDLPRPPAPRDGVLLVFGPGAALVEHDLLWYLDLPKRYAEAAISAGTGRNLGQPAGAGTSKRLFYVDWPILDRHRDAIAATVDCWIDTQGGEDPVSVDGATLRRTIDGLATRPFRTRPTFNTTPWGGHWAQRTLGVNRQARNTALGYELIAPESGVLIGDATAQVEVPFQLVVSLRPEPMLGTVAHQAFGTSFPIRFDYLDTVDGGNLSVHCHPQSDYMRRVFGWPYTQHETYYLMVAGEHSKVYLGLRGDVDLDAFHTQAHEADQHGRPFDIEQHVQTFPARTHQLFLVPAGTPHGSGEGNVVLEVSATPYLYSLRFYDWLRRGAEGTQRPVHVEHAFNNLNTERTGDAVRRDLVQEPRTIRAGAGWREELLGALPEMFFEVRRMAIDGSATAPDHTADRFHVVNVVEGAGVLIETASGHRHTLAYAETLVLPAAVGQYTVTALGDRPARLVKALVR